MSKKFSKARRRHLLKVVASPLFRHNTHPGVRWTGFDRGGESFTSAALLARFADHLHVVEAGTSVTFLRLGTVRHS